MKIIESRNKREGRYVGWRVTGGRNTLNWSMKQINHERAGRGSWAKAKDLRYWSKA